MIINSSVINVDLWKIEEKAFAYDKTSRKVKRRTQLRRHVEKWNPCKKNVNIKSKKRKQVQ